MSSGREPVSVAARPGPFPPGLGSRLSLAFALYLLLSIVVTLPMVLRLASDVPHDPGDPLLNTWILWWNAHHLPLSPGWWDGLFFYPASGTLAFSEHLLGLAPITTPIQWLGGSPLLAYNIALLLSFPLSGLAMHLLCLFLTRRHDLALIGGLAYAFAPYRMGRFDHIQTLSSYYMPLALLGLHAYRQSRRAGWLALFGAAWLMQSLCNGYYLVYFSVLVVLWLAWFGRDRGITVRVSIAWALAALPLVPILLQYGHWHAYYGVTRAMGEIERGSGDLTSFFQTFPWTACWPFLAGPRFPAIWLFPGLTLPLVVACAVASSLRVRTKTAKATRTYWVRLALASGAALFSAVALSAAAFGSLKVGLGGVSISVRAVHKPLSLALFLLAAAAMSSPTFAGALRRCSTAVFYLTATITMWVLALGPSPRFRGMLIWDKAPYWWLMQVPGVATLRQPSRFGMLAAMCLSVAAVLAMKQLLATATARRWVWIALVAAGVLGDGWISSLPLFAAPVRVAKLESVDVAGASVLELPPGLHENIAALYRSTQHGHPVVNGYSGYTPLSYEILRAALGRGETSVLAPLRARGPLVVVIDAGRAEEGSWKGLKVWKRLLDDVPNARFLGDEGQRHLYLLPRVAAPPPFPSGQSLPIRTLWATRNALAVERLVDGDRHTYWETGKRRRPGDSVTLELAAPGRLTGLVLSLDVHPLGAPRYLVVDASLDGDHWQTAWRGETTAALLASSLRTPRELSIEIPIEGVLARFVRLTETRRDPLPWMMAEVSVLGAPP